MPQNGSAEVARKERTALLLEDTQVSDVALPKRRGSQRYSASGNVYHDAVCRAARRTYKCVHVTCFRHSKAALNGVRLCLEHMPGGPEPNLRNEEEAGLFAGLRRRVRRRSPSPHPRKDRSPSPPPIPPPPGWTMTNRQYLSKWVTAFKNYGIQIWAATPQNEPDNNGIWESCVFTLQLELDFIA